MPRLLQLCRLAWLAFRTGASYPRDCCAGLGRSCPFLLVAVSALSPFCFLLSPVLSPFLLGSFSSPFLFSFLAPFLLITVSALSPSCFLLSPSLLSPFVSGLVSLLVCHCVRLVSLLFPIVSGLVTLLVGLLLVSLLVFLLGSLLVDHCVRLVSLLFPFVALPSVPLCLRSCLPSCVSLCPPCLPFASFCVLLVSLLVGHCQSCPSSVSFCLPSCLPSCWSLCPFASLLVSLLVGHCVRLVPLLSPFVSGLVSLCWSLCPLCLPSVSFCSLLVSVIVSVLSPFCFLFAPFLSPFLLAIVSVLSPFCFLLSPFLLMFNKWTWECFVVVLPVWGLRLCNCNYTCNSWFVCCQRWLKSKHCITLPFEPILAGTWDLCKRWEQHDTLVWWSQVRCFLWNACARRCPGLGSRSLAEQTIGRAATCSWGRNQEIQKLYWSEHW